MSDRLEEEEAAGFSVPIAPVLVVEASPAAAEAAAAVVDWLLLSLVRPIVAN